MDFKSVFKPFGNEKFDMPNEISDDNDLTKKYEGHANIRVETETYIKGGSVIRSQKAYRRESEDIRTLNRRQISPFGPNKGSVTTRSVDEVFILTPEEYQDQLINKKKKAR